MSTDADIRPYLGCITPTKGVKQYPSGKRGAGVGRDERGGEGAERGSAGVRPWGSSAGGALGNGGCLGAAPAPVEIGRDPTSPPPKSTKKTNVSLSPK